MILTSNDVTVASQRAVPCAPGDWVAANSYKRSASMKGGLFEGRRESAILLLMSMLALIWSGTAFAGQKIRMYEMNSKLQQRSIVIGGAAEETGCHDLLWGKRIYRFVQTGFQWCSLYEQEGCAAD